MVERERAQGPVLLVDSGNALFKVPGAPDDTARRRAQFLLDAMGGLGTQAMAAGERDLAAGWKFLRDGAARAHVKVLSANFQAEDGSHPFEASAVLTAGATRVGLVGLTAASVPGAAPTLPAALEAGRRLKPKVDVLVALAAIPYADAFQIAQDKGCPFDFILQSHDARGAGMAQRAGTTFVMTSGERGRQVGRLKLTVKGKGPFADAGERERGERTLELLDRQLKDAQQRKDAAPDDGTRKQWQLTLDSLAGRRAEVDKQVKAPSASGRTFSLEYTALGNDVPDDAALAALVAKIEPSVPAR